MARALDRERYQIGKANPGRAAHTSSFREHWDSFWEFEGSREKPLKLSRKEFWSHMLVGGLAYGVIVALPVGFYIYLMAEGVQFPPLVNPDVPPWLQPPFLK